MKSLKATTAKTKTKSYDSSVGTHWFHDVGAASFSLEIFDEDESCLTSDFPFYYICICIVDFSFSSLDLKTDFSFSICWEAVRSMDEMAASA